MKHLPLDAWPRQASGTGAAHKVRAEGFVPAILLGHHEAPVTLKVKTGDVIRVLKQGGQNALVDLTLEGDSTFAMVREFVRDPVTRHIIHIDFQRVLANEPIDAAVPIVVTGQPAEEYPGFVVTVELSTLHVKGLPDALPAHIDVDAGTLQSGHPLHAGEMQLPEGVTLVTDPSIPVAVLTPPAIHAIPTEEELEEEEVEETQVPETGAV